MDAYEVITTKSESGAASAPCPAEAPMTRQTIGTWPERSARASRVVRRAPATRVGQPMAGALEHHHERHLLLERELRDPVALRGAAGADRSAEHREVLGARERAPASDRAEAAHEAVGGDVVEPADQRADLAEAARVEERLDALARVALAPGVHVLLDALRAAHRPRSRTSRLQVIDERRPGASVRLALALPAARSLVAAARLARRLVGHVDSPWLAVPSRILRARRPDRWARAF